MRGVRGGSTLSTIRHQPSNELDRRARIASVIASCCRHKGSGWSHWIKPIPNRLLCNSLAGKILRPLPSTCWPKCSSPKKRDSSARARAMAIVGYCQRRNSLYLAQCNRVRSVCWSGPTSISNRGPSTYVVRNATMEHVVPRMGKRAPSHVLRSPDGVATAA
jgi:hypothetical protein